MDIAMAAQGSVSRGAELRPCTEVDHHDDEVRLRLIRGPGRPWSMRSALGGVMDGEVLLDRSALP